MKTQQFPTWSLDVSFCGFASSSQSSASTECGTLPKSFEQQSVQHQIILQVDVSIPNGASFSQFNYKGRRNKFVKIRNFFGIFLWKRRRKTSSTRIVVYHVVMGMNDHTRSGGGEQLTILTHHSVQYRPILFELAPIHSYLEYMEDVVKSKFCLVNEDASTRIRGECHSLSDLTLVSVTYFGTRLYEVFQYWNRYE